MSDLTLVVVGADIAAVRAFDETHCTGAHVVLSANYGRCPLAALANCYLDTLSSPVFGLCHADAWFGPGSLDMFTGVAMAGAVCGIVGCDLGGHYRWAQSHAVACPVSTLDGCAVFFRRDLGLRFDEQTFDGLHCHVEDLCLQAHAQGIPVVVPAANATHHSAVRPDEWIEEYQVYRERLAAKWQGTEFQTT